MLELVASEEAESRPAWDGAPGIARDNAIHGFHHVTLWVEDGDPSERVLIDTLGFRAVREENGTRRYAAGDGGPGALVDVRVIGGFPRGTSGAGTVHHVAWKVGDDSDELEVRQRVVAAGIAATPGIDRKYSNYVYLREPGGVLYELATAQPGFAIDEPVERLGERLMLPLQYEPQRAEIEAILPRIHLGVSTAGASAFAESTGPEDVSGDALDFVHRYIPPASGGELAGSTTLLLLHGTGGDENDMIPLGRALLPGAAILSPRGKVLEHGAARFFRRLAAGVFDQEDLALRTEELSGFVEAAERNYGLDPHGVVAVGFSNGANIAASILLRRPDVLRGAVLLSPMVPFEPESLPKLEGTSVFIGAGRNDPMVKPGEVERLAEILREAGAEVTMHWEPGGHTVTEGELQAAREWIARLLPQGSAA
jgi:predicted esterase/catechol 2,3-dioxygenase-like lactoylglutathione lyase family enzyme